MSDESFTAGVESDPLFFENCYPDPYDELQNGGWPGISYAYVSVANQKKYMTEFGLWLVPNNGKVYTISGPKGQMDCIIMGHGEPIRGADPSNGLREWYVDHDLEEGTGVSADPKGKFGKSKETLNASAQGKKQEGDKQQHTQAAQ